MSKSSQNPNSGFVQIGQIVGAHGIKGHVKVQPFTDFLQRFKKGSRLRLKGDWVEVKECMIHKDRPVLLLSSVKDRNDAEALQWQYLECAAGDLPELEDDEYLTEDLLGLKVVTEDGLELGEVDDVLDLPAQSVLVVGEVQIPMVKEFVKDIDLDAETITVHLIPGMLGEE